MPTLPTRARLLVFALIVVALSCVLQPAAPAQSFDSSQVRSPVDLAESKWLFHAGDDPAWAAANFDDSHWSLVDTSQKLTSYTDTHHDQVFWYRIHIRLDGMIPEPSIKVYSLARAYSIFVNGQLLVQRGGPPGHEYQMYSPTKVYPLPAQAGRPSALVLALRCVLLGNARTLDAPLLAPGKIQFGNLLELEQDRQLGILRYDSPWWVLLLLQLTVGVLALSLYRKQRTQRDYFWIALLAAQQLAQSVLNSGVDFLPISRDFVQLSDALLDSSLMLLYMGFYSALMKRGHSLWARLVWAFAALSFCLEAVSSETSWLPESAATVLFLIFWTPLTIYPLLLIANTFRRRDRESLLMLIPFASLSLEFNSRFLSRILVGTGALREMPAFFAGFQVLYLHVNSTLCVNALFWLAIPAIIVFRSNRLSEENARIAGEVEAARQIQQVLLPDPAAQVPGFLTQSVYLPASQVGGDFFQLLPTNSAGQPDGGLLLVVGDVSGKGLPAAMLVSVLVGAIRAEAAHGTDPGTLLAALNQTLLGQARGGFATCLSARITATGEMTIANAGHLSPYLDGNEFALPGALPLGLAAGVSYDSDHLALTPGNRLTFYSDGVPEAQNQSGEMLGFDRARDLSTRAAEEIARQASAWGQTDDITVLTVSWNGPGASISAPDPA